MLAISEDKCSPWQISFSDSAAIVIKLTSKRIPITASNYTVSWGAVSIPSIGNAPLSNWADLTRMNTIQPDTVRFLRDHFYTSSMRNRV